MKIINSENTQNQIKYYLQRISNILLINGGFFGNPGLYTGEMGLALFFARYSRFTQKGLYLEYSFDLIEKIQNRLFQETPIDYKNGLTGIGSAIEYLVQYGYFEVDTDFLLEDFDKRLFIIDNLPYLQIEELLGIGYYALWRLAGNSAQKFTIIKTVLPQLVQCMDRKCQSFPDANPTIECLKDIIVTENIMSLQEFSVIPLSKRPCRNRYPYGLEENTYNRFMEIFSKDDHIRKSTLDLGLKNGLAGFGMALMTELDGDDSWISLIQNDLIQKKDEPLPV